MFNQLFLTQNLQISIVFLSVKSISMKIKEWTILYFMKIFNEGYTVFIVTVYLQTGEFDILTTSSLGENSGCLT